MPFAWTAVYLTTVISNANSLDAEKEQQSARPDSQGCHLFVIVAVDRRSTVFWLKFGMSRCDCTDVIVTVIYRYNTIKAHSVSIERCMQLM